MVPWHPLGHLQMTQWPSSLLSTQGDISLWHHPWPCSLYSAHLTQEFFSLESNPAQIQEGDTLWRRTTQTLVSAWKTTPSGVKIQLPPECNSASPFWINYQALPFCTSSFFPSHFSQKMKIAVQIILVEKMQWEDLVIFGRGRSDSQPIGVGGRRCDSTEDNARMGGQDSPGGERAQSQVFTSVWQRTWEFEDKHREGSSRGWASWMVSPTQWTWISANSGK